MDKAVSFLVVLLFSFSTPILGQTDRIALVDAFPNLRFSNPVFLTHSGDGSDRVFVVEQSGTIRVFANDASATDAPVFLDIRSRVTDGGERGLLGLAFHPDYASNGQFYVNYTTGNLRTRVSRFSVDSNDPDRADSNSEVVVLEFDQPFSNHNAGMIQFGLDGFLYVAVGDGGSGGDPQNNGQDRRTILGNILRIDVDNPTQGRNYGIPADNPFVNNNQGFREEIWAYGLRNPWRFSIDPPTGQLWAGDVGQGAREEIDIIERGNNYGWNIMEGTLCFNPSSNCDRTGLTLPIKDYPRSEGRSITGGYVYRGALRPEFTGAYIYADYVSRRIWLLRYENEQVVADSLILQASGPDFGVSSFGLDESSELYILDHIGGAVYRFSASPTTSVGDVSPPRSFILEQNFPNPFNPITAIRYQLTQFSKVELTIFNHLGQRVKTLENAFRPAGSFEVEWDGTDELGEPVASGLYVYRLKAGASVQSRKMLFLR